MEWWPGTAGSLPPAWVSEAVPCHDLARGSPLRLPLGGRMQAFPRRRGVSATARQHGAALIERRDYVATHRRRPE